MVLLQAIYNAHAHINPQHKSLNMTCCSTPLDSEHSLTNSCHMIRKSFKSAGNVASTKQWQSIRDEKGEWVPGIAVFKARAVRIKWPHSHNVVSLKQTLILSHGSHTMTLLMCKRTRWVRVQGPVLKIRKMQIEMYVIKPFCGLSLITQEKKVYSTVKSFPFDA